MALVKRGKRWYGDSQADIAAELIRYSKKNGYLAQHFADAVCTCGGRTFGLLVDDTQGAAVRTCKACGLEHPIGDRCCYLADLIVKANNKYL